MDIIGIAPTTQSSHGGRSSNINFDQNTAKKLQTYYILYTRRML